MNILLKVRWVKCCSAAHWRALQEYISLFLPRFSLRVFEGLGLGTSGFGELTHWLLCCLSLPTVPLQLNLVGFVIDCVLP